MELLGRRFGHIRVTEVVGQGGMGDVYAGFDEKLERKVALKVLNSNQRLDDEARERLLREARALSKLEHPHICRIHDYIESADCDLLVLEYIDGRTLHAAMQEPMSRAEMLRIAIAIAEVLVTAHRAGIVHRDLKPENVMLTKSGEVKVLDFGLARWLSRARARSSGKRQAARLTVRPAPPNDAQAETLILGYDDAGTTPTPPADYLATAVGITLGTPLYMSPEQARGESLTPASDMFSFGLLLQKLFTGIEPHPEEFGAREVILRVAQGETRPVTGAAGDVTALINRLKQFAPTDRPTAVQTLELLRHMYEKPQRIARSAIVAVLAAIALLGVWRYTVDLRAARAEADARRAQAEDLIEFMLGDLRKKLEPVGRLEVLDDVGERALKYVGSSSPETMSASDLTRGAKPLNQLVEVRIAQGKLDEAMTLAERSLQMTTIAARKMPDDPEVQLALGTSHFWVGNVWRLRGDLPQALARMQSYSAITEALARAHPGNDTYVLERAYGHSGVATILELQGKLEEALRHHTSTRQVKAARLLAKPDDPERIADVATTDNKIGFVLYRVGNIRGARQAFERELAAARKLVAADPKNAVWQEREARSRSYMALVCESMGDYAGAVEHARAELAVHARLAEADRENANWQRRVTLSQIRFASLMFLAGDPAGAHAGLDRAEALARTILPAGDTATRIRAAAMIGTARARIHMAAGNDRAAAAALEAARVALRNPSLANGPTADEAELLYGDLLQRRGDTIGARASWAAAEQRMAASSEPRHRMMRAMTLVRLERHGEAGPILDQLAAAGYRHPELSALRDKVAERAVQRETRR